MRRLLTHLLTGLLSFVALGFLLDPTLYAETISLAVTRTSLGLGTANTPSFTGVTGTTDVFASTNLYIGGGVGAVKATNPGTGQLTLDTFSSGSFAVLKLGGATFPAAGAYIQIRPVAVASLPSCVAGLEGALHGVTDANSTTYNATAAGGGANHMAVFCNGTNWVLH